MVLRGMGKGCTLPKVSKTWGFCSSSKNIGRCRTFEEDLQRCKSRGGRITRDMFTRDVKGQGGDFLKRLAFLERQIFRFAKMILRDRCSTLYDLASLFRGRRSTLNKWNRKIAKRNGTRPSALHSISIFEGSLAQLLRFWCRQLGNLRKSRRIASSLTLSRSRNEEVSQDSFVFKLAERQTDRQIGR